MSGWFVRATLVVPRRRMEDPAPEFPLPPEMLTPAIRPVSSCETLLETSGASAILIWPMELPTSRLRAEPAVPVTTTSSSETGAIETTKSTVAAAPATTSVLFSMG
jgi:hypothetical protein